MEEKLEDIEIKQTHYIPTQHAAGRFVDGNGTFLIEKIADYVVENQM